MGYKSVLVLAKLDIRRYFVTCDICGKQHGEGTIRSPFNDRGDIADDTLHTAAIGHGWRERFVGNIRKLDCPECAEATP